MAVIKISVVAGIASIFDIDAFPACRAEKRSRTHVEVMGNELLGGEKSLENAFGSFLC